MSHVVIGFIVKLYSIPTAGSGRPVRRNKYGDIIEE